MGSTGSHRGDSTDIYELGSRPWLNTILNNLSGLGSYPDCFSAVDQECCTRQPRAGAMVPRTENPAARRLYLRSQPLDERPAIEREEQQKEARRRQRD
jgi:hypothetical protein